MIPRLLNILLLLYVDIMSPNRLFYVYKNIKNENELSKDFSILNLTRIRPCYGKKKKKKVYIGFLY